MTSSRAEDPRISRLSLPRLVEDAAGAALIEFAISLPVLLLLVAGIFDFGLLFQKYQVVTNAAREGARMRVLPGYSDEDAKARVTEYLNASGITGVIPEVVPVQIAIAEGTVTGVSVKVKLKYTFAFLGPIGTLFGGKFSSVDLTAVSVMRSEVAAGGS